MSDEANGDSTDQSAVPGPPRCGHHGTPLTYIETRNPSSGVSDGPPWGWRCPSCFPEAFPGWRNERRRLQEVSAVVRAMQAEVDARHAYSGDPDPRGTTMLEKWTTELAAAVAVHRPPSNGRSGTDG